MSEIETDKKHQPVKKAALGRGLGSLLGGQEGSFAKNASGLQEVTHVPLPPAAPPATINAVPPELRIWNLSIDKLSGNLKQPRKVFEKAALAELAASIKQKGILQPIVVRKIKENLFEIIAGERRWRAAQQAGLHEVPVIIKQTKEQEALELALIENIQREDLNPVEEAEAYALLMREYNMTQQEVADRVGKDRATVANIVRLNQLSDEVKQMLLRREISLGQAKIVLSLSEENLQNQAARQIKEGRLTVRQAEALIARLKNTPAEISVEPSHEPSPDILVKSVAEELQKRMGTRVSIDYVEGKGKLAVYFYSKDELNQIIDKLRLAWPN